MSDYERWTIYPLLLLTLGIVLKDKMLKSVDVQSVVCRSLAVVDAQGNEMVRLGATQLHAGGLEVFGANGAPLVTLAADPEGKRGRIATKTDDGHPLVDLIAHGDAGAIVVYDARGASIIGGPQGQVRFVQQPAQADTKPKPPGDAHKDAPPANDPPQKETQSEPKKTKQGTDEKSTAKP